MSIIKTTLLILRGVRAVALSLLLGSALFAWRLNPVPAAAEATVAAYQAELASELTASPVRSSSGFDLSNALTGKRTNAADPALPTESHPMLVRPKVAWHGSPIEPGYRRLDLGESLVWGQKTEEARKASDEVSLHRERKHLATLVGWSSLAVAIGATLVLNLRPLLVRITRLGIRTGRATASGMAAAVAEVRDEAKGIVAEARSAERRVG